MESQPWAFGKLRCQTRVVNKHTNRHYQGASERHILFKIIMNICCFLTRIHSGWLERVSTWKVTVIHSLESVGCLVLFGSSQLSKSNCQWLPCASHMGYSVHTPSQWETAFHRKFKRHHWTSGDLVGTSALHVQLVRRTSQHWIVIWTLLFQVGIPNLAQIVFNYYQMDYKCYFGFIHYDVVTMATNVA